MPKNTYSDWDTNAANNTDIGGININEGCDPGNINNAIREMMAQLAGFIAAPADPWAFHPIGEPIALQDNISGVSAPPTNKAYRYIKLTASDSYNTGVLTSESVSGSTPLISATATISLTGSPLNGRSVRLINTERRFVRAGNAGGLQDDASQGHYHNVTERISNAGANQGINSSQINRPTVGNTITSDTNPRALDIVSDGTNGTPRIDNETRGRNIGATYYMRIK